MQFYTKIIKQLSPIIIIFVKVVIPKLKKKSQRDYKKEIAKAPNKFDLKPKNLFINYTEKKIQILKYPI